MKTDHYLLFKGTRDGLQIIADVCFTIQHSGKPMTVSTGCRLLLKWEEITTSTVISTHKHSGPVIRRFIPDEFFTPDAPNYEEKYEPTSRSRQHAKPDIHAYFAEHLIEQMYQDILRYGINPKSK